MIVISGALVLIALVLLVLGLTMTDLNFVYGSIGVSLVSFVFLVIGILQRRGEPAQSSAPEVTEEGTGPQVEDDRAAAPTGRGSAQFVPAATTAPAAAASPAKTGGRGPVPVVEDDQLDDDLEPGGGPVLVVPGRPRYHVEGCRYLAGKPAEEIDVLDAQDDGFTPCGVCKPDETLEELYGELVEDDEIFTDADEVDAVDAVDDADAVEDTGVPGAGDDEPPVPAAAAGRRGSQKLGAGSTGTRSRAAATPKPTKATSTKPASKPATKAPAKAPRAAKQAPSAPPVAPTAAPSTAALPTLSSTSAAAPEAAPANGPASAGRTKVVVIPDRDRFHVPSCRFVRDALGTEELTRTQAAKQGYRACGVCKP